MKLKWSGKRTLVAAALLGGVLMLYVLGEDQRRESGRDGAGGTPASNSSECRMTSTGDDVRVRSAPVMDNTNGNVVDKLSRGEETAAEKVVQDGFRKLGEGRWVKAELVTPVEGSSC